MVSCFEGEIFDPSLNMCRKGTGCLGCEKKIYDPNNCRGFFACDGKGKQRVWRSCSEDQIFDSVTSECVEMQPW
ncbi:unnamed protein product [Nezara viridula]|uniref:Chitin-binding type-2 domain-containing protein n=1 Tax=Nezara viridula TaxID=85310 RepID=A0A9P0MNZ0_NEZVI|nr:unnamed protein product [Nezara viridula]